MCLIILFIIRVDIITSEIFLIWFLFLFKTKFLKLGDKLIMMKQNGFLTSSAPSTSSSAHSINHLEEQVWKFDNGRGLGWHVAVIRSCHENRERWIFSWFSADFLKMNLWKLRFFMLNDFQKNELKTGFG